MVRSLLVSAVVAVTLSGLQGVAALSAMSQLLHVLYVTLISILALIYCVCWGYYSDCESGYFLADQKHLCHSQMHS